MATLPATLCPRLHRRHLVCTQLGAPVGAPTDAVVPTVCSSTAAGWCAPSSPHLRVCRVAHQWQPRRPAHQAAAHAVGNADQQEEEDGVVQLDDDLWGRRKREQ